MKVYIHFQNKINSDAFEGVRLRKTLKGACEHVGVSWVNSLKENPSIAHFLSPRDLKILRKCKNKGLKAVVSAFFCENDISASFCVNKNGKTRLKRKSLAMLKESDAIIVPNDYYLSLIKEHGLEKKCKVLQPCVNLKRFDLSDAEEKLFPSYYLRPNDKKYIVVAGTYDDKKMIEDIKQLALLCPEFDFYFFGVKNGIPFNSIFRRVISQGATPNLFFEKGVEDDIYRSALHSSFAFLILNKDSNSMLGTLDAYGSLTNVIVVDPQRKMPNLLDEKYCIHSPSVENISSLLRSPLLGDNKKTIIAAYRKARGLSLSYLGSELLKIYNKLLGAK